MASTIQSQTIGSADLCIALAASQFGRAHGYGDNWNTLRVALLFAVEDTGANLTGSLLRVGLCKGTNNMPGDATTDNSYGIKYQATWNRANGTYYEMATSVPWAFSRVAAVETTSATNIATANICFVNHCRECLFLDIIKGSPNYTFKAFVSTATTGDVTPAVFLAQAPSNPPAIGIPAHTYLSPTGTALAIDTGTNGILDTVYVGWNLLTPRLFISNLAVVKLA
jgi:hypothetical protein